MSKGQVRPYQHELIHQTLAEALKVLEECPEANAGKLGKRYRASKASNYAEKGRKSPVSASFVEGGAPGSGRKR